MKKTLVMAVIVAVSACGIRHKAVETTLAEKDPFRPKVHFTPLANWMNDPNGMVFYNNKYHLFYQYYPDSTVWGPMHWAHATSTDLVHWEPQPTAIYPDSLGYIFSGSAVVDKENTSGLGINGKPPLVAIYTSHDPVGEKAGSIYFQNQSIAYSNDEGQTWIKYAANPVLKNPGVRDFRDPKVTWYEPQKKWIMTLATQDRVSFFSSPDLKRWTKESEFGKTVGAHGGVWECPDLFTLDADGKEMYVLLVSINPGGPNGGSATQYFTGHFDGHVFNPTDTITRWIDYGPDNYAGITWSNTGTRKIFIGWMSNWLYADKVPTKQWRGAATIPRELRLKKQGGSYLLSSLPVKETSELAIDSFTFSNQPANGFELKLEKGKSLPAAIYFSFDRVADFSLSFLNNSGEKLVAGFDMATNRYYVDRSAAGISAFYKDFATVHFAPRLTNAPALGISLILDETSLELFVDDGLTVMTSNFFPKEKYTKLNFKAASNPILQLQYKPLKSIYH